MANQFIAMELEVEGAFSTVWQKIAPGQVTVVNTQIVTYVDAQGVLIVLPETYEMAAMTGDIYSTPGNI